MQQQRIIIVGAGIVGLATAYALLNRGVKGVTVLEQEAVDHPRATSHGTSRLLRFEYGAQTFYSEMVLLSLSRWQALQQITRRTLYMRTGLLSLGRCDDGITQPGYHAIRGLGLPVEWLSEQHCTECFPQFNTRPFDFITYNIEAGILHASAALRTLKDLVRDLGGDIRESCRVQHLDCDRQDAIHLHTDEGGTFRAGRVILATGPWIQKLLPDLLLPIRISRQYLLYFSGLPISLFGVNNFPAFIANETYGFPMHSTYNRYGSRWLKAASHLFGPTIDPNEPAPQLATEPDILRTLQELKELIPALQYAELAHIDRCMYDLTPDSDFILDSLPGDQRVILASGLSGHGFKFGPLLGELLSALALEEEPVFPLERFRLARFQNRRLQLRESTVGRG